ncbi:MAG: MFS transporter [Hyphomicrobiaceae bacterium]
MTSTARGSVQSSEERFRMMRAVVALGITQITAWGTSYYCLGVLAASVGANMHWTSSFVFLGYTVAVLVMAVISGWVGRLIDIHGGRVVMSIGSVILAAGLYLLSHVTAEWAWLAVWGLIGVGMRCCLYDAAFAALVQEVPGNGRRAISYLTLFGAFASSVFWVVGHYLDESLGWRQTLVVFAVLNLIVCLPLHWFGLSRHVRKAPVMNDVTNQARPAEEPGVLHGRARTIGIALFALIMSINGYVFGVTSVQLVPMLEAAGLTAAAAVWVASLKGFAQFGGRVVEIIFGRNLSAISVARIAIAVLPLAFVLLYVGTGSLEMLVAFTAVIGASQGVVTIVRGAVPLALFGTRGYGAILGFIATPVLVVSAAGPTIYAWIIDNFGWKAGNISILVSTAAAVICMEAMAWWHRRAVSSTQ